MSTATYAQGMKSYNNTLPQGGYRTWKGTGINSFPVGITPGNVRPFTNKDYFNNFPTGFGLPRPIKHYRVGRGFNYPIAVKNASTGDYDIVPTTREVRSSTGGNLVKQLIDDPGAFSVMENRVDEVNGEIALATACEDCHGIGVVASYKPNLSYLTNNPEPDTTNPPLCCNEEKKALQRVIYASTNLKPNYYTTHKQYLQNRCKLYNEKAFNFLAPNVGVNDLTAKPGSPAALAIAPNSTYLANCQCNAALAQSTEYALASRVITSMLNVGILTQAQVDAFYAAEKITMPGVYEYIQTLEEPTKTAATALFNSFVNNPYWGVPAAGPVANSACNLTVYKPNNYKFAKQGAVSSSTRTLKLNVTTIETNAATIGPSARNYAALGYYNSSTNPFILKSKVAACNPGLYLRNGNPKTCSALAPVGTNKVGYNAGRNGRKSFVQNITG